MDGVRVLLAGGGTAGHVNPLLATAHALETSGAQVCAVGTPEGLETELVPASGIELRTVDKVPFPRSVSVSTVRFPLALRRAIAQAGDILDDVKPHVVVGFGGYASTPVYIAAKKRGICVVVHEQNAKPGMANKLAARFAAAVALTFASTPLKAAKGKTVTVGLPLRDSIARLATLDSDGRAQARREAAQRLGVNPDMPTLLVTGGSLGAQHLNEVFQSCMVPLSESHLQILHLTGKGKDAPVLQALKETGGNPNYHVKDYLVAMEDAYAVADLAVCRSGAGTVAELAALGVPAFFVPLPIGNGEQELNARDIVAAGGAQLVRDKDFTAFHVLNDILPLVADNQRLSAMSKAAQGVSPTDAAHRLAGLAIAISEGMC